MTDWSDNSQGRFKPIVLCYVLAYDLGDSASELLTQSEPWRQAPPVQGCNFRYPFAESFLITFSAIDALFVVQISFSASAWGTFDSITEHLQVARSLLKRLVFPV
jgi:hypothetical protein